jgi:cytoskeletal protein RodZ
MFERNRIAEALRSAREKRGLSLEQAAADAGIPLQYLRLLEGESNVRIGVSDELYLIPFFRKYAHFVGIDAEEMLPEFLGMVQQVPGDSSPPVRLAYRSRYASLWRPLAVLLGIGVAATMLLRQPRERPAVDDGTETTTPAATVEPVAAAEVRATTVQDATPATAGGAPTESPTAGESATPVPVATAVEPVPGQHALQIAAKEDAWLALALDDQPSKQFLLHAGESRTWSAGRFTLTIGNAGGVVLTLDGKELGPIGKPGRVVKNLRLPEGAPEATPHPAPTG